MPGPVSRPPRSVAATSHAGHGHRDTAPGLERLGGALNFSDVFGRPIGEADFRDYWTLLFFGYSRCRASCPTAIPTIVQAAERLRGIGIPARAMFVDIDAPPGGTLRFLRPGASEQSRICAQPGHDHGNADRIAAMRGLARHFTGRLTVVGGTRGQLSAATRAFNVSREHTPPRAGEHGHSINHSSLIYFLAPTTRVVGYAMHDRPASAVAQTVRALAARCMRRNGSC